MKYKAKYRCQIKGIFYNKHEEVNVEFTQKELDNKHDAHLECLEKKKPVKEEDSSSDFKSNEDLTVPELKSVLTKDYDLKPEDFKGKKKDDLVAMLDEKQAA